ncbi:uncharacterized protein LOC110987823 [Acanthaster planci]|uniref:Uncharacterized protein LOC110987823 n=1 Tax=Acanthaster planci TaxID=133434 RepID=A0A8B7ZLX7_ACAPL|nr:uncharacterized protein LOC110987823 [Acanthaster planci]
MESRKANLANPPMPVLDCYQLFGRSGGEIEQSRNEPKRNESADKRENIQAEGMKGRPIQVETPMEGTSSDATRSINGNSAPETCKQPGKFGDDGQIHHQCSQQQASQGQEVTTDDIPGRNNNAFRFPLDGWRAPALHSQIQRGHI